MSTTFPRKKKGFSLFFGGSAGHFRIFLSVFPQIHLNFRKRTVLNIKTERTNGNPGGTADGMPENGVCEPFFARGAVDPPSERQKKRRCKKAFDFFTPRRPFPGGRALPPLCRHEKLKILSKIRKIRKRPRIIPGPRPEFCRGCQKHRVLAALSRVPRRQSDAGLLPFREFKIPSKRGKNARKSGSPSGILPGL